jgi:histidyl-tRNA synthetase
VNSRPQAPRGTFDVLPEQASARLAVENATRRILEGAGYRRIETPIFEHTELFARGVGESTDIVQKEMFAFETDDRSHALRPEGTAPVGRAFIEHGMHKQPLPVKLWYLGPFFRKERPQAGRFRQFFQIGAEVIGADDPAADAETIVLLHALLAELGVRDLHVRIGSLGTPATRATYRDKLVAHLRAHEDQLSEDVRSRIDLNPLRAFDADHPGTREVMASAPLLMDELDAEDAEHFAQVRALLDTARVPYDIDPTLVRGLDYYARTVFEFTSGVLGAQSAVGGGGRYDGLIELIGGPPTPAVGWAVGVERILLSAEPRPEPRAICDLYVAVADPSARTRAFELATTARQAGLNAQLELAGRSMKGQLKQADRAGAAAVAIVGPDGIELKDMASGEQEPVADVATAVARTIRGRHPA